MLKVEKNINPEIKPQKDNRILAFDFDGTIAPIIETNKKSPCNLLNQWSVICFLALLGQQISTDPNLDNNSIINAWKQFQDTFIDWAHIHGRENTQLVPENNDPDVNTQPQIILAEILEKYSEQYRKWIKGIATSDYIKQNSNDDKKQSQPNLALIFYKRLKELFTDNELYTIFDPKHTASTKHELLQQIYIQHIKDIIWLLATFEFWHDLGITVGQLKEYGRFIGGLLKPDLVNQIVETLESDNTVIINTFGVQEITLTAVNFALKQKLIEKGYTPEEAEGQINYVITTGKLQITGESYAEYCKLIEQNKQPETAETLPEKLESYLLPRILPLDTDSPITATPAGKVVLLFENKPQEVVHITALGDSERVDGPMIRYAQMLNTLAIRSFESSNVVTQHKDREEPNNAQPAPTTPLPRTQIIPKYIISINR